MFSTDELIKATLQTISATTGVILATGEVITATLKVISAITKVILASNKLVSTTEKISKPLQSDFGHWVITASRWKSDLGH